MSEKSKNKFCPYCGKRLAIEDPPLRKLDGDLSGMLNPDKPPRTVKSIGPSCYKRPREYIDWKIIELEKEVQRIVEKVISEAIKNYPVTALHFSDSEENGWLGEEKVDTYGKDIDEKNKQLDEEVEDIVKDAIKTVNSVCLLSGVPCDPDTSDAIKYIGSCLEKMKKEEKI